MIEDIERDIRKREEYLSRCLSNLHVLSASPSEVEALRLMEQEAFFIQDQLDKYYSIYAILREEQVPKDEMLQTV